MAKRDTEDRHRSSYIPFRCSKEVEETITKIAAEQRLPKSEVVRGLVSKGLVVAGYKQDEDALRASIQSALKEILQPQVERLATISAKSTQLSGAAYFLLTYVLRMYFPEGERDTVDEVAAQARQLGIEYLKLKQGSDIDNFIKSGVKKMADNDAMLGN